MYTVIGVKIMNRNITFNAEEKLIEQARQKAMENNTTLNKLFRHWLSNYARETRLANNFDEFMTAVRYANPGRSFTRDDLNER